MSDCNETPAEECKLPKRGADRSGRGEIHGAPPGMKPPTSPDMETDPCATGAESAED